MTGLITMADLTNEDIVEVLDAAERLLPPLEARRACRSFLDGSSGTSSSSPAPARGCLLRRP